MGRVNAMWQDELERAADEIERLREINADLLEALEHSFQFLVAWRIEYAGKQKSNHVDDQRALIEAAIDKAKATIAKAKGE